jgi:hypothetical protein
MKDLECLRDQLVKPRPVQILLCSPSETTLRLLETMFIGFRVSSTPTQAEAQKWLEQFADNTDRVDFVILDTQSGDLADDLATVVEALGSPSLVGTKIVHIYTPTKGNSSGISGRDGSQKVLRLTKPPRTFKMLQTLVRLRNPLSKLPVSVPERVVEKPVEDVSNKRDIAGMKILIAEGKNAANVRDVGRILTTTQIIRSRASCSRHSWNEQSSRSKPPRTVKRPSRLGRSMDQDISKRPCSTIVHLTIPPPFPPRADPPS